MKHTINLMIDGINPDKQLFDFINSFEHRQNYKGRATHVHLRVVRYNRTDYVDMWFVS